MFVRNGHVGARQNAGRVHDGLALRFVNCSWGFLRAHWDVPIELGVKCVFAGHSFTQHKQTHTHTRFYVDGGVLQCRTTNNASRLTQSAHSSSVFDMFHDAQSHVHKQHRFERHNTNTSTPGKCAVPIKRPSRVVRHGQPTYSVS